MIHKTIHPEQDEVIWGSLAAYWIDLAVANGEPVPAVTGLKEVSRVEAGLSWGASIIGDTDSNSRHLIGRVVNQACD